ncbi:MAG: dicarboxylate/amino acid:cation symporter [Bacteroidetes bacterium HGW-Bacteroidetes-17]|jgi:Na+/H+-dicarboxylate symporter|nr:MAG: dicarboxylate/amino acid:cation symporter [Bacteroidetes bacterium HGW-Bacteroidetes-17]
MKKKIPLWLKIIIGMILGVVWGLIAVNLGLEKFTSDWIKPWGTIFIKLLKLIAVPLIFISLVKGVTSITDVSKLTRIGIKTLTLYMVSTIISVAFGLFLVNTLKPGDTFPEQKRKEFQMMYEQNIKEKEQMANDVKDRSPLYIIEDIVPDNIFKAASDNTKMLQVIFFSILFAVAMLLLDSQKVLSVKNLFDSLNEIIIKIVDIIMKFAPIGVFALLAALISDFSADAGLFWALGKYAMLVSFGLIGLLFVLYPPMILLFTKVKLKTVFRALLPTQMVAFSTSSSNASLPVNMRQCNKELGVSESVANFVLPIGATVNMNGTSFYQAISAVFIAQVFGLELTLMQQLTIVLTATLAAIGTPGVPGGGIIMMVIVLGAAGIPAEGLALILGIDRPLDMIRTAVNVSGDAIVAVVIAHSENELDYSVQKDYSS